MENAQEIRQIELIIDDSDIMIKQFVAGKWRGIKPFTGFEYQTPLDLDAVECYGVNNQRYSVELHQDHHSLTVNFPTAIQPNQKYSYKLHMLLKPSSYLKKIGSLNIFEWPKEDLTGIIFLRKAGPIFFSSALAQIKYNPKKKIRTINPGNFAKSLTSHSRKASAIRIEWGIPPKFRLKYRYLIKNPENTPIYNMVINSYIPPSTKFQQSLPQLPKTSEIITDEDENWIMSAKIPRISPNETMSLNFAVDLYPIGNKSILVPNFGKWEDFQDVTQPGSIGEGMIQPSSYWQLEQPSVQKLIKVLKKNTTNASKFIKLAFEFVNQKIAYVINNRRAPALETLQTRKGDCSEMADLFVTLLRGGGIPAKIVHGWTIDLNTFNLNPHAWCEFFSPKANGWRQCDPTWGYLTGVSCQHICRQREGLIPDLNSFNWRYQGNAELEIIEEVRLQLLD